MRRFHLRLYNYYIIPIAILYQAIPPTNISLDIHYQLKYCNYTVLGVILQLSGLGFINTTYSLFLKEQVGVTPFIHNFYLQ